MIRFFSAPIMVLYVADRLSGLFWYRATNETKLICKYNIDNEYVILFIHVPDLDKMKDRDKARERQYLGDVYWLNTKKFVKERQYAHPFTTFYNHSHELYANIEQSLLFSSNMRHNISHRGHRFQSELIVIIIMYYRKNWQNKA